MRGVHVFSRLAALSLALGGLPALAIGGGEATPRPGEAIYREGVLPSGAPLRAVVSGDVPIEALSAACATCHRRSGMGSVEARVWVPPITGRILGSARGSGPRLRPSYDDATLVRALKEGVDVSGRPLDPLMPRYDLKPEEFSLLTTYLHGLGSVPSPGVTESEIRFATVVTPDADPVHVRSMLDVFDRFFRNKNVQVRSIAKFGTRHGTFRKWTLDVWKLTGPPSGWAGELDAFYAKAPVFALLGGAGGSEWGPVDAFCERHEVPCLLPNVDVLPPSAGKSYYTLYVSRGVAAEAAAVAAEIARDASPARVVQLVPLGGPGLAGADALRSLLATRKDVEVCDVVVPGPSTGGALGSHEAGDDPRAGSHVSASSTERPDPGRSVALVSQTLGDARPRKSGTGRAASSRREVVVFWVPPAEALPAFAAEGLDERWDRAYVSSTVLDGETAPLAALPLPRTEIVHPFTRPDELAARLPRLENWLKTRAVPDGTLRIQDQTFLACVVAGESLMHEYRDFDRDYFLELVDHVGSDQTISTYHAKLSFGPGQRILEHGCWLLPGSGEATAARWVSP